MPNIDLRPAALPIVVYYKGDVSMRFNFTSGGSTYPLTGATAAFVISEKNGTAALSLSGGSGLTINEAGGYIDLAITNAQIIALASQEYNYEFSITISGDVWPIMDSVFIVSEDGQADATSSDISVSLDGTNVDVSVVAPAGSIGHTIQDEGVSLTDRDYLNFTGAGVTVTDAGGKTVVAIPGGGGSPDWGDIGGTLSDQADLQTALDGKVDENAAITGATKTKITYDAKGLVTAGADAAIADITGLQTALDGKAATAHTHSFADLTDGTFGGTRNATVATGADFNVRYSNTARAIGIEDGAGISLNAPVEDYSISAYDDGIQINTPAGAGNLGQVWTADGNGYGGWEDAAGGGGSVEIIDITYADMETALGDSTLTPGQFYRITDASGTDLGFICQAIRENEITVNGQGGYLNADFQAVGDYDNTPETFGTQQGIWTADGEGDYSQGDVVIWNLLHYQLTDSGETNGGNPEDNENAYTLLDKATYPETYVEVWDISEFDFQVGELVYRQDARSNLVRRAAGVSGFKWGQDESNGNNIQSPESLNIRNLVAVFLNNTTYAGAYVSNIDAGAGTTIQNNIIENGASLTIISTGSFCDISRNKIGQGATLGGDMVLADGALVNDNTILNGITVSNKTFAAGVEFSGNTIGVDMTETETITENIIGKRAIPGFSDIPATIDITGLTAIDFTAAWAQYRGVYNLTSSNATETIAADSLSNFPTLFPFRLISASGLTLTLTGTAAASATNGSIVMSGATIVLDGTNGDWVELEADSTGTFVRVKNVQIYA